MNVDPLIPDDDVVVKVADLIGAIYDDPHSVAFDVLVALKVLGYEIREEMTR